MAQAVEKKSEGKGASIFKSAFSSFAVKDVQKALDFYGKTLGLSVSETMGGFRIDLPGTDNKIFVYSKEDHEPATFTVFNLHLDDVGTAAKELRSRGVEFESYDEPMKTDKNGIFWGKEKNQGPNIAWFTDPSGNIISILEEM